jgi:hypothetical protein
MPKVNFEPMEKFFKENIDMIQDEMSETDVLYEELKQHFDAVKKSSSSGALTFISKQTPNLVSLRNNKISLMNNLVQIKKLIVELSLKTKDDSDSDSNVKEILKGMHELLLHNKAETYINEYFNDIENKDSEPEEEQDYDKLLEERMKNVKHKNEDDEEESESNSLILGKDYTIVVDEELNMYAVDKDYNILEDAPLPAWTLETVEDEEGYIHVFNEYDEELDIVSLDEEEEDTSEEEDDDDFYY